MDLRDGAQLELTGTLREALLAGRLLQEPDVVPLARLNPVMKRLVNAIVDADSLPLTRHLVLRGAGWTRLFIELTGQCNEKCAHCYAGSSPDVKEHLDEATVLKALDEAYDLGFSSVQLTGGDPLLSKSCVPAARHARDLGYSNIELYTNGLALTGQLFQELRDLEVSFAFSLYGQDPLVHDTVTGVPGSHRLTLDAIRRTGQSELAVRVGIVDTATPGFDLDATRALAHSVGVPETQIHADVERSVGRGDFRPTPAVGSAVSPGMVSSFSGTAAITYDGNIYPCIFSRDLLLGSVYGDGLAAALKDETPISVDTSSLAEAAMSWSDRLTCRKCQFRAAILTGESEA